jgi:hypothetical protein
MMQRVTDYLGQVPGKLQSADENIARAWRERNMAQFVKLWIVDSIALGLFGFLMPLILGGIGIAIVRAYHFIRPKGAMTEAALSAYMSGMMNGLWNYAVVFGLITAFLAFVSAIPIISLKGGRRT